MLRLQLHGTNPGRQNTTGTSVAGGRSPLYDVKQRKRNVKNGKNLSKDKGTRFQFTLVRLALFHAPVSTDLMLTDTVHVPGPVDARSLATGGREGAHGIETFNVGRLQHYQR